MDAVARSVSAEYEADFISTHREELERIKTALKALESRLFSTETPPLVPEGDSTH
jgi:hypothetical protein